MLLSPFGERLGEGVMQEAAFVLTPSPNLSPKGERNMSGGERSMKGWRRYESDNGHHGSIAPVRSTIRRYWSGWRWSAKLKVVRL
jgi:hypothetical protein